MGGLGASTELGFSWVRRPHPRWSPQMSCGAACPPLAASLLRCLLIRSISFFKGVSSCGLGESGNPRGRCAAARRPPWPEAPARGRLRPSPRRPWPCRRRAPRRALGHQDEPGPDYGKEAEAGGGVGHSGEHPVEGVTSIASFSAGAAPVVASAAPARTVIANARLTRACPQLDWGATPIPAGRTSRAARQRAPALRAGLPARAPAGPGRRRGRPIPPRPQGSGTPRGCG